MNMRSIALGLLAVAAASSSGCRLDVSPTLPPFTVNYNFPLLGGAPILGDLFLPNIDSCETFSEEALVAAVGDSGPVAFLLQLLFNVVRIENVSVLSAVMEARQPEGGSFDGLTEVTFLENDRVLLTATSNDGINGGRVELGTEEPINLIDVIDACPERASTIRVRVRGLTPLNSPTQWSTTVRVRVVAKFGLFQ